LSLFIVESIVWTVTRLSLIFISTWIHICFENSGIRSHVKLYIEFNWNTVNICSKWFFTFFIGKIEFESNNWVEI